MALKRTLDAFLESDNDNDDDDAPLHKKSKIENKLYIVHIGPFALSTSEADIRRFVFRNKSYMPCDVVMQIRKKQIFAFIAYKSLSNALGIANHYKLKRKKVCELVGNDYNKYCKLLYDRSLFSDKTHWIQLFGITQKNLTNEEEQNWITKLLKWEYNKTDFNILNIRTFHNVRYPAMSGFAFIQIENNGNYQTTQELITHFRDKWINDTQFKYWLDFANPKTNFIITVNGDSNSNQVSKQLIFSNLYWKTSKTLLGKHICCLLGNDFNNLQCVKIKVNATANGYPNGNGIVSFESIDDAKLVQTVCDGTQLFDQVISVRFYAEETMKVVCTEKKVTFVADIDNEVDVDSDMDSEIEEDVQTQIHDQTDSEYESESESESDMENESEFESDFESDFESEEESGIGLKDRDILSLWKWNNPNRKIPHGLLSKKERGPKAKRKENWLTGWKKRERIAGKDKFWIRSGKLVHASQRWRDRAQKKSQKIKF